MNVNCLKPKSSVLVKLGSIAVHSEEMLSDKWHSFDINALEALLKDSEVQEWLEEMNKLALLPVKR